MQLQQGIPTISDYSKLLDREIFFEMEKYSDNFLKNNTKFLKKYWWSRDPFHQWSRQWEYPFTYLAIKEYICNTQNKNTIRIIDAGSGATFFPYFLMSKHPYLKLECCDSDKSLEEIFTKINSNMRHPVEFKNSDIRKLSYSGGFLDIIYCISVLEHTKNYEEIITEFKRILKLGGMLIVTFDISLDGASDIPINEAMILLKTLNKHFKLIKDFDFINALSSIQQKHENILTTNYIQKKDRNLLPWSYSVRSRLNRLIHLREDPFQNLTIFCILLTKL